MPSPGPGTAPTPDEEPEEEAPHVPGMQRISPEAAAAAEKAAAEKRAKQGDDATVSEERLRELKEHAKANIEARLVARRKQRRLLRGGDVPGSRKR